MALKDSVRRFRLNCEVRASKGLRALALELDRRVVFRTPVDEINGGHARRNWHPSIGSKPEGLSEESGAADANAVMEIIRGTLDKAVIGDTVWLSNSVKYIGVLEYGEFPNPPKRGTYIRSNQSRHGIKGPGWIILSAGGYSQQAPQGMVRVTAAEFGTIVSETKRS